MVDLGVDGGGGQVPLAQHLGDLGQANPEADKFAGQRVAQPVALVSVSCRPVEIAARPSGSPRLATSAEAGPLQSETRPAAQIGDGRGEGRPPAPRRPRRAAADARRGRPCRAPPAHRPASPDPPTAGRPARPHAAQDGPAPTASRSHAPRSAWIDQQLSSSALTSAGSSRTGTLRSFQPGTGGTALAR